MAKINDVIMKIIIPCTGIFGWLFGHKYISNYDELKEPVKFGDLRMKHATAYDFEQAIKANTKIERMYVNSVCTRCGYTIDRNKQYG